MALLNLLKFRSEDRRPLLERCLSIDLEVDPKTARIFDIAAVQFGGDPVVEGARGRVEQRLDQLEKALANTPHVIGHNILRHDIEHLLAARPRLRSKMPAG